MSREARITGAYRRLVNGRSVADKVAGRVYGRHKETHRCFAVLQERSANAMDRGLELHRPGARTLQHMPTPVAEILNTEGSGARTLQHESMHS